MCNPLPQAYWESELCWRSEHLSASASSSFSSKPWDDPKVMTSNLCQNHQTTTSTPAPHPVSWCSHLKEIVCFPFSYFSLLLNFLCFISYLFNEESCFFLFVRVSAHFPSLPSFFFFFLQLFCVDFWALLPYVSSPFLVILPSFKSTFNTFFC